MKRITSIRKRIRDLEDKLEESNTLSDEEYEQFQAYQEIGVTNGLPIVEVPEKIAIASTDMPT